MSEDIRHDEVRAPATSTGQLMLHLLATLAEYERELIVERIHAGIAAARDFDSSGEIVIRL